MNLVEKLMSLLFRRVSPRRRFRLTLRALAISFGLVFAFVTSLFVQEGKYGIASMMAFLVICYAMVEFIAADLITDQNYPSTTKALLSRLEDDVERVKDQADACIRMLATSLRACDRSQVDGTLHLKVEFYSDNSIEPEQALVQVINYPESIGRARKWSFLAATNGIVGRCLRTGQTEFVNFGSQSEYETRMVTEFGFTREAATKQHTTTGRSYCAHPITIEGRGIVGVLYLFSTEPQVFPWALDINMLEGAATHLASYLKGGKYIS